MKMVSKLSLVTMGLIATANSFAAPVMESNVRQQKSLLGLLLGDSGSTTISSSETLSYMPSSAYRDTSGNWVVDIRGWVREPNDDLLVRLSVEASFLALTGYSPLSSSEFWFRTQEFLSKSVAGEKVAVNLGGTEFRSAASESSGVFTSSVKISDAQVRSMDSNQDGWLVFETKAKDGRSFKGVAQMIEPEGVSIISDVDDTIKVAGVGNYIQLVNYAFLFPTEATPGMQKFITDLKAENNASIHYLTASPIQLNHVVQNFIVKHKFPMGSVESKPLTINPPSAEIFSLLNSGGTEAYKTAYIEGMMKKYPKRNFIFVGDSSEKDPEIYGSIAKKYGDRVLKVYIRNVSNESEFNSRMSAAFGSSLAKMAFINAATGEVE